MRRILTCHFQSSYHINLLSLSDVRKDEILNYLRPDGKVQVTVEYDENDQPKRIDTIVVSTQHAEDTELKQIEADIKNTSFIQQYLKIY